MVFIRCCIFARKFSKELHEYSLILQALRKCTSSSTSGKEEISKLCPNYVLVEIIGSLIETVQALGTAAVLSA